MNANFLDSFSLGALFLLTVAILLVAIEIGFIIGRGRPGKKIPKAQSSQVRAIMGATLGLLAFMTAFTFATAQSHYEARVANMVEEARLANNAFLLADFLEEPFRTQSRGMLREYIGDRLRIVELNKQDGLEKVWPLIQKAEAMHLQMWDLAVASGQAAGDATSEKPDRDPFSAAVVGLIDIHALRLQAALANRIPLVIWMTLYLTGILSMFVMGYQAGLVSTRSPYATMTLAVSFAAIMMLITDLDRPVMSMFSMNQQVMYNLAERMDIILAADQR